MDKKEMKSDDSLIVDIWVGYFPTETIFDQYFEEQYDNDESSINPFGADQGELFYDHDLCERKYHTDLVKSFDELIKGHSYWRSYLDEAQQDFLAHQHDLQETNVSVLVWGREINDPRTVIGDGFKLIYLGRFTCDPAKS